jgi:type VI secretion system protein ImpB
MMSRLATRSELKEIPFVVGVLGDYSGKPEQQLPRVRDRKFIEIDRDNFNQVLAGMKPGSHTGSTTS